MMIIKLSGKKFYQSENIVNFLITIVFTIAGFTAATLTLLKTLKFIDL